MGYREILTSAMALPMSFVGLPDWRVFQMISWYLHHPFGHVWMNVALWWAVFLVFFVIWWAWIGAEWLFGPREDDDE